MDATGNSTTANVPLQLPPPLAAYIDGVRPAMYILLFCAVWLGVAIPLMVVLFYTSSETLRKSAVFITNVIGIAIALTLGVLNVTIQTNGILDPLAGLNRDEVVAYTFLSTVVGPFVDCILFFRVVVVFPRRTTSTRVWVGIMLPLVLFKIARFVNLVVFMCQFVSKTKGIAQDISEFEPTVRKLIGETIEWSLQLADNTMCSSLFLWTLKKSSKTVGITSTSSGLSRRYSYRKALGTLFWIATTNFVFPCMFDIVLFILFFRDPDGSHYLIVLISNNYIQLIGVLFATVWRATRHQSINSHVENNPPREMTIRFARNAGLTAEKLETGFESGIEMTESVNINSSDGSNLDSSTAVSSSKESGVNDAEGR